MKLCKNCDGFVPEGISFCPNCGKKVNVFVPSDRSIKKIVSGMASLSVSMTLMACYGQPPREEGEDSKLVLLIASTNINQVRVVITAPKDLGTLTIELGAYKFVLSSEERSSPIYLYPSPYHYKITDSSKKVLFEAENFYFGKNVKDGIILRSDAKIEFSGSNSCYHFNGLTGNLESLNCSEL